MANVLADQAVIDGAIEIGDHQVLTVSGYNQTFARGALIRFTDRLLGPLRKLATALLLNILDTLFLTFSETALADIEPPTDIVTGGLHVWGPGDGCHGMQSRVDQE
jgi:hypothetical protein